MKNRGLTAVELLVVIIVAGIAAAVTVPALLRVGRNDKLARCDANLRALWKLDADARAKGQVPAGRGSGYWTNLVQPGNQVALLTCPLSTHDHYRGPASDPVQFVPGMPVGADAAGSHGAGEGGNVLLKVGEVRAVRDRDGLWQLAAERLAP